MIVLKLRRPLKIDGAMLQAGDTIEADGELADALLRSGDAVPVELRDRQTLAERLERIRPWITRWK